VLIRHGRDWSLERIARVNPHSESPFVVSVGITASNLRSKIAKDSSLEVVARSVRMDDLVSLDTQKHLIAYPTQEKVESALKNMQYYWLEYDDPYKE
jgi:hypothetical protein